MMERGSSRWAILAGLLAVTASLGGPYVWTSDPGNDASGGSAWEIYGMGYRFEDGNLDIAIKTNVPETARWGGTSYGSTWISPGDLYLNIGGSYAAGTGTSFGLGMTTHLNGDIDNDPNNNSLPWKYVYQGGLYKDAVFSTGTYEDYGNAGYYSGTPWDGDGSSHNNNYPALIADYSDGIGYQGDPVWNSVSGESYEYLLTASIDRGLLGLDEGDSFEVWWTTECGNDAVKVSGVAPAVPEPASLLLLSLGCAAVIRRRKTA